MTDTIPACNACRYFKEEEELFCTCSNPKYNVRHTDFINGKVYYSSSLCAVNRQKESLCGEAGRGWEGKPASEIREESGIVKWFNLF